MWWNQQNLSTPRRDAAEARWHFRVWHDVINGRHKERVFFWDDRREFTGVVLLRDSLHVTRLHDLIEKLVADPDMREVHRRDLRFPVERHYAHYEVFPEEASTKAD